MRCFFRYLLPSVAGRVVCVHLAILRYRALVEVEDKQVACVDTPHVQVLPQIPLGILVEYAGPPFPETYDAGVSQAVHDYVRPHRVTGVCIDRVHVQNIKQECMIITKKPGLSKAIMEELGRGVTAIDGEGMYTEEDTYILITVISKYEEPHLRELIAHHDEHAFMIISDNIRVVGNFQKRFTD